eukprot:403368350
MTTLKHRYQLLEKISENQAATIHKGFDKKKERNVIIKIGFPIFYANGSIKKDKKFVVLSRHGYDLHTIHKICGYKFSYKTVLNIGIEILERIEKVHQFNYIYNNFSPHNVLIPLLSDRDQGTLYLIDFRKCRKFDEIPQFQNDIIQAKIDDLECLFFLLCYFTKGQLPWSKPGSSQQDIFRKEARSKMKVQQLQDYFIDMDEDFVKFYKQIKHLERTLRKSSQINDEKRSLQFFAEDSFANPGASTKLDYGKFRTILFEALYKHQSDKPYRFDWFPILTKIQRHNRKQGQQNNINGSVQSGRNRTNSNNMNNSSKPVNKTASLFYQQFASQKQEDGLSMVGGDQSSRSFRSNRPEESKIEPQSPVDPFMYLNSMGGRHALQVPEKRKQSIKMKQQKESDNSVFQQDEQRNLHQNSPQVNMFKRPFDILMPDDVREQLYKDQENEQNQKNFLQVKSIKALKLKRERSKSVKYDEVNDKYVAFVDDIGTISDKIVKKEISNNQESQLYNSPSFSHSDMDQFSVDLASPAIPNCKKDFELGDLIKPTENVHNLEQQSASISQEDNQAGDSSHQEAGEESKEEEKDQSHDISAIYSSDDDKYSSGNGGKQSIHSKNLKQSMRQNSLASNKYKQINRLRLEKILKCSDGEYEECQSATIDKYDADEFDEGITTEDYSVPIMNNKINIKWARRLEEESKSISIRHIGGQNHDRQNHQNNLLNQSNQQLDNSSIFDKNIQPIQRGISNSYKMIKKQQILDQKITFTEQHQQEEVGKLVKKGPQESSFSFQSKLSRMVSKQNINN